jgi:hypothetical protein
MANAYDELSGREWYPVIFAELERIGATEQGIGVREVESENEEPGIWIEFFAGVEHDWVCALDDAPLFLDAISADEIPTLKAFGSWFRHYFEEDDDEPEEDEAG